MGTSENTNINPMRRQNRIKSTQGMAHRILPLRVAAKLMEFGMESLFWKCHLSGDPRQSQYEISQTSFSNSLLLRFGKSCYHDFQILLCLLLFFIGYDAISTGMKQQTRH
jgi:hypothetical protein